MHFEVTTPREYLEEVTLPNFEEFRREENHLSARHAINAVLTAFHLHEWVFSYYASLEPSKIYGATTIGNYRDRLVGDGLTELPLIRDIAVGAKHLTLKENHVGLGASRRGGESWETISWDDLGGAHKDHFVFSVNNERHFPGVTEVNFEMRLASYVRWWKGAFVKYAL